MVIVFYDKKGCDFSPHHHVQTGSGAHPASSYPMGTGDYFPGGKTVRA